MRRVFLGPAAHWLLLVVLVVLGWLAGRIRLHVTHFDLFVIGVIAVSVATLVVVLATTRRGERVTRDPIRDDAES